jgi:hypothetical protein
MHLLSNAGFTFDPEQNLYPELPRPEPTQGIVNLEDALLPAP